MEIVKQIMLFFILSFLFIIIAQGEDSSIEKTSTVTLLKDGVIKVETLYKLDLKYYIFVTSDAINSSGNVSNISIKINDKEIPEKAYGEYTVLNRTFKYVALKEPIFVYAKENEINMIDIKYEIKLPTYDLININLLELSPRTDSQVDVNSTILIQSSDKSIYPIASGTQDNFFVPNYMSNQFFIKNLNSGYLELTRIYKSSSIDFEKINEIPIDKMFMVNISFLKVYSEPYAIHEIKFPITDGEYLNFTNLYIFSALIILCLLLLSLFIIMRYDKIPSILRQLGTMISMPKKKILKNNTIIKKVIILFLILNIMLIIYSTYTLAYSIPSLDEEITIKENEITARNYANLNYMIVRTNELSTLHQIALLSTIRPNSTDASLLNAFNP